MPHDWEAYDQSLYLTQDVISVDYSPDGKFLAVQTPTSSEVYEVISGDLVFEVEGRMPPVVFCPNSDFLAVVIDEGVVGVFRTGTFDLLQKLEYSCHQVLFMPDSETLLLGIEGDITILNWKTQEHLVTLSGVVKSSTNMKMLPDGDIIAMSFKQRNVSIWNIATGTCKQTFDIDIQSASAESVACSANGNRIAVATMKCVNVWDLTETSAWIQNQELVIHVRANALALSADGQSIIAGLSDGDVRIFDFTGTCVKTLEGHSASITSLSVYHTNKQLASGSHDGTVKLWDFSSIDGYNTVDRDSTTIESSESDGIKLSNYRERPAREIRFSPSGKMLVSVPWSGEIEIWHTDTGFSAAPLISDLLWDHRLISFTSDDRLVAVGGGEDESIQVWDTTTGEKIRSFSTDTPIHICLSPDGKNMAVLENNYSYQKTTSTVRFLNLAQSTPSEQHITHEPISRVSCLFQAVISDNFKHIAQHYIRYYGRGYQVGILSHNSSQWHEYVFPDDSCDEILAFSPDAKWLLAYTWPDAFKILETSMPHAVLELQFPKSEYPFSSVCNTMDISYKIATQFGTIGFGKPDALDFATRIGWGVSLDEEWIMRDNERMIWVPLEYRYLAVDTHGSRVAFACPSGKLTMMELERED